MQRAKLEKKTWRQMIHNSTDHCDEARAIHHSGLSGLVGMTATAAVLS